jgi:hypothetical protein
VGSEIFSIEESETVSLSVPIGMAFKNLSLLDLSIAESLTQAVVSKGFGLEKETIVLTRDEKGIAGVTIKQMEAVEVKLGESITAAKAYLVSGDGLRDLPIGANLDPVTGTFSWVPVAGHYGDYLMVFITADADGQLSRTKVKITIE